MPEALRLSLLAVVAFIAAMLAAVTGFGGAAVLLPMLVFVFGVREAIPILTVAQLIGNGSRVWFNRRELDWRVVAWFAPAAACVLALAVLSQEGGAGAHATALALVMLLLAVEWIDERRPLFERLRAAPAVLRWSAGYAALALLLVFGRWQAREFIYMQF